MAITYVEELKQLGYLRLSWTPPAVGPTVGYYQIKLIPLYDAGGYDVEQPAYTMKYETQDNSTSFVIANLEPGLKVNAYIRAVSVIGWKGTWSTALTTSVMLNSVVDPPSGNIVITPVPEGFRLNWTPIPGATEYLILLKDGTAPSPNNYDVKVRVPGNSGGVSETIVNFPYTDQQVYFKLYTVGASGDLSTSFVENNEAMLSSTGPLNTDDVSKIKKLKNLPTKDIDLKLLEELASYGTAIARRGDSSGNPVVSAQKIPMFYNISIPEVAGRTISAGGKLNVNQFLPPANVRIISASVYQINLGDALGDATGISVNIGRADVGYVTISLGDASSSPVYSVPSSDLLPSDIYPVGTTLDVLLTASSTVTFRLNCILNIVYQEE